MIILQVYLLERLYGVLTSYHVGKFLQQLAFLRVGAGGRWRVRSSVFVLLENRLNRLLLWQTQTALFN